MKSHYSFDTENSPFPMCGATPEFPEVSSDWNYVSCERCLNLKWILKQEQQDALKCETNQMEWFMNFIENKD
jgi:hypothetical protein